MSTSPLQTLLSLWDAEASHIGLIATRTEMLRGVQIARSEENQATDRPARLQEQLDREQTSSDELQKRLDQYTRTVRTTKDLIDSGQATDFDRATRQLAQCRQIVDDIETELLELFDTISESEGAVVKAKEVAAEATATRQRAEQRAREQMTPLSSQLEEASGQIRRRREDVPLDLLEWYDRLRASDRVPIAEIRDKACSGCRIQPPNQTLREIRVGKRVHRCRNCSRFLWIREV